MENEIKIIPPEGYEVDPDNKDSSKIVFRVIKSKYPKSWEEAFLGKSIEGFRINSLNIEHCIKSCGKDLDIILFKKKSQLKSAIAYAKITQLMALPCYNGDWVPNWTSYDQKKLIIRRCENSLEKDSFYGSYYPIAFKSFTRRDAFYENHMDLLRDYFELD